MKYYIYISIILSLFTACKSAKENNTPTQDSSKVKIVDTTLSKNNSNTTKHFSVSPITKEEYEKVAKNNSLYNVFIQSNQSGEETEKRLLKEYSSIANRNAGKLTISTKAGKKTFLNNVSKNPDINANDSSHFLIAVNKDFAFLQIVYYESGGAKVVDLNTGQDINLWGLSYPSPSGKQILSTNVDLEAGMEVNGIQLVSFDQGKWKIKWEEELDGWGITEPIWIDENTLYFKEERIPKEGGENIITYKKMVLQ